MTRSLMRLPLIALALPFFAACSTDSPGSGGDAGTADGPPTFAVDPSWPQQLPNDWILGSITSVFVDDRDHVWITHLPETLTPEEIAAVQDPPLGECCVPAPVVIELDTEGSVVQGWGDPATQDVSEYPRNSHGLFIDHNGFVWIGTFRHHRVMKFTRSGEHLMTLGAYDENGGSADTSLLGGPAGMWVDPETNEVFVADGYRNRRVVVFDADTGAYLRHWGAYGEPPDDEAEYDYAGRTDTLFPPPQFSTVHGLVGSNDGLIYVADRRGNRIQTFLRDGTFVAEKTIAPLTRASGSAFVLALSPDAGQRWLYLADGTNHKVWILERSSMEVVGEFGRGGRQVGQFIRPHGMDVDSHGNIYVGEASTGRRVQKFVVSGGGGGMMTAGDADAAEAGADPGESDAAAGGHGGQEAAAAQAEYEYDANCAAWPAVTGPHTVGTVDFEVTDHLRSSHYAPTPTASRRIFVRAWYPATGAGGSEARRYFTGAEATVLPAALLVPMQQPPDAFRGCASLATNSYTDASPAGGSFPVIGFNHGYTSYPAQQSALFEHLAANGYVVLSVGHPYESGGIVYPNGDAVTMSPRIMDDMMRYAANTAIMTVHYPPSLSAALEAFPEYISALRTTSLGQLAQVWQSDVQFVLDRLEAKDVPRRRGGGGGRDRPWKPRLHGDVVRGLHRGHARPGRPAREGGDQPRRRILDRRTHRCRRAHPLPHAQLRPDRGHGDPAGRVQRLPRRLRARRPDRGGPRLRASGHGGASGRRPQDHDSRHPARRHQRLPRDPGGAHGGRAAGRTRHRVTTHRNPERPGARLPRPVCEGGRVGLSGRGADAVSRAYGARSRRHSPAGGGAGPGRVGRQLTV